ncbi:DNA helicase II [Candidatus Thioglobus sp. NP1]|uniref:DNA helicase II n=1 Tax=Candidatus Thioglobus sp. NP1 TaxID=2508687 RepID=UPI000DED61EF|nr:DNA helicase II [Candidatus Thioglobus sp. NP1]AXE61813.1 DNA helicase II [Candidatus Thioglobus sp. NP1]
MISPPIVDGLNEKQQQSVALDEDINALILAGAGSGKTRVLTHRIHYLVSTKNYHVDDILAVTFTNKAANEMKERLSDLLRRPIGRMWVGTFHSLAHRLLRTHPIEANLSPTFQILDAQDQFRIIKRLMKENGVDETKFPIKKVQWFINQQKDEGILPHEIDAGYNFFVKQSANVFDLYEKHCQVNDLVDFAGLLVKSYGLLKNNQSLLEHYQNKFRHILVDEFQDTNRIQYQFIKILHNQTNHVFCVGDDDQSIYGWRGAKIENIQKIENDFKPIQVIKLEQNYRSTGNILSASNALIANNQNRLEKSLWTESGDGDLINVLNARTETEEAQYVVGEIQTQFNQGRNLDECAILYRSNAQSRVFEESLIKQNLNYRIYGGLRFFERAEIKDAMGYIRLIENTSDNIAFERIVNFPTRGIGLSTIEKIRSYANENQTNLFQSSIAIIDSLPSRAANALQSFIHLIEAISDSSKNLILDEKVDSILLQSGLMSHYANDKSDKAGSKRENLDELVTAATQYVHEEDNEMNETQGFIALATLDSSGESNQSNQSSVQLMTVHSAKGLEFPVVFLVGLEEDLFPSRQSKDEPHLLDEERRLCYVGMTRAMKSLTLSYASRRFLHGQSFYSLSSRFLDEIPKSFLNYIKNESTENSYQGYKKNTNVSNKMIATSDSIYSIGQVVKHAKFGLGTILNYEGSGDSMRLQINFQRAGTKWLISSYANLEIV